MSDWLGFWWTFLTSLLWLTLVHGEACYSQQSGFVDCWNGCCGPSGDEDCCSSTVLVLGLGLGGAVVVLTVVVVVVCWVCKDCRPKAFCCCCYAEQGQNGQHSDRRRRRHRNGRTGRSRRVVVYPVEPPDYTTATQERAPSVQPGFNRRTIPLSPPPPYIETIPPPPTPPLANTGSVSSTISTPAAPPGIVLVTAHVPHNSNEHVASGHFAGQMSNGNTSAFAVSTAVNASNQQQHHGVNSAFVLQSLGTGRNRNSAPAGSTLNSARLTSSRAAEHSSRNTSRAGSTTPAVLRSTDPATSGAVKSTHLVQVKETPNSGDSQESAGSSSYETVHGRRSVADSANPSGGTVPHSVSQSAGSVAQLDLI